MIQLIYGSKGTGKTKQIIDRCNEEAENSTGDLVFITDTNRYMYDIKYKVRFINVNDFSIKNESAFINFMRGMLASNTDIKSIYIDGAQRITGSTLAAMESFYSELQEDVNAYAISFVLTVSAPFEDLPAFLKNYIK